MGETEFLRMWDEQLARFCVDDLMPAGQEAALLQPLASVPAAAERLVRRTGLCDDHRQRRAAAILAGFARVRSLDLLDELFERESERAAAAPADSLEPLYSQAVVEDVVLAATRWCRSAGTREPALSLLRKVIERTLVGEYWSSAPYALTTLLRYNAPGSDLLLQAFAGFAFRCAAGPPRTPEPAHRAELRGRAAVGGRRPALGRRGHARPPGGRGRRSGLRPGDPGGPRPLAGARRRGALRDGSGLAQVPQLRKGGLGFSIT